MMNDLGSQVEHLKMTRVQPESGQVDRHAGDPLRSSSAPNFSCGKQPVAKVRSMEGLGAMPELLSEPDEDSFGAPDVAEPIRVFVLSHFADEFRAAFTETGERIVDVLHGKHHA